MEHWKNKNVPLDHKAPNLVARTERIRKLWSMLTNLHIAAAGTSCIIDFIQARKLLNTNVLGNIGRAGP
jgi:hypothetical protein